jgi:drug/metabolite transporter (DMT)-like permease
MKVQSRFRDWILLLLCNLMWASQYSMVKVAQEQMGPVFATFFPVTLATIMLVLIVCYRQRKHAEADSGGLLPRKDVYAFVMIGVFGQIPAQLFITWGVKLSLASNAALFALTLPVVTAVMAYFLLGERMTTVRWVSFAFAIIGVLECSGINWRELNLTSVDFLIGNLLIFGGICGSSFYNVYSKKLLRRYSPLQVLLYSYYAVFVVMLPITLDTEFQGFLNLPHFALAVWGSLIILALFVYCLSMVLFLNVLTRLDATQAALSNYLIPFFGLGLAAIILHERMTGYMVVGGILVLMSTLLVTVYEERRKTATES